MNGSSGESLRSVGYCPQCGYDQRGLPVGSNCPECGSNVLVSLAAGDINRWAEHVLLKCGSIAILQTVGLVCGFVSLIVYSGNPAAAVMVGMAAVSYLVAGSIWYLAVAVSYACQRWSSPRFKNMSPHRRVRLARWMLWDGILFAVPILLAALIFV